jgi:hypothetical protein
MEIEHGRVVDLQAALELFDDVAVRAGGGGGGVSFIDFPRAFHIYFECSQGSPTYELYLANESISGTAGLATLKQGVTMFFSDLSPIALLRSDSIEVYEAEG